MSRALDSDIQTSSEASNPQEVYHDIAEALQPKAPSLLEIEFLGKSHPLPDGCNVLIDGNSIGISKAKLVQAFVVARNLFFTYLDENLTVNQQDVHKATSVMLLMDAENTTAANTRKRLIQRHQKESVETMKNILVQELLWVDGMLTSRLHRHTKSPTLWGHRRWVLEVCKSISLPYDVHKDLKDVIMVSGERHPRNYYAWQHMRWVLENQGSQKGHSKELSLDDAKMLSMVLEWCTRHPSDTSGFSFLLYCLLYLPEITRTRKEVCSSVCEEVLKLTSSFQWTHESIWVFLRTLVASGQVKEEQKAEFFRTIQAIVAIQPGESKAKSVLSSAKNWCLDNQAMV